MVLDTSLFNTQHYKVRINGKVDQSREMSNAHLQLIVKKKVKLTTVVEGDPKAPFSIATTLKCKGGRYSFPWIAPLYPRYAPYVAEC